VGLLGYWYWRAIIRPSDPIRGQSIGWFVAGLFCIWLGLDWPVGALGAGYLATFHTVTYILLSLVAPPCLLLGIPEAAVRRGLTDRLAGPLIRGLARPLVALTIFNVILLATHVPAVVDGAMSSQLGALTIDLGWFLAGVALWWPVLAPARDVGRLRRPMKMAYLFAATLVPIIPSAFLTFAEYPLYSTYELAPRIFEKLTAQQDQQVAGLIMKLVGDLPVWFAFGVLFFRWAKASEVTPPPDHPGSRTPIPSQV
jgi:cytochrome c oxidase assembly factor CtaG